MPSLFIIHSYVLPTPRYLVSAKTKDVVWTLDRNKAARFTDFDTARALSFQIGNGCSRVEEIAADSTQTFYHAILFKGTRAVNTIYHQTARFGTYADAEREAISHLPTLCTSDWLICVYRVVDGLGVEVDADGSQLVTNVAGGRVIAIVPAETVALAHAVLHDAEEAAHAAARALVAATIQANLLPQGVQQVDDLDSAHWALRKSLLLLGEAVVRAANARKTDALAAALSAEHAPVAVVDPCCHCGESTACGSGKFVNRIPSDGGDPDGPDVWACEACTSPDLDDLVDRAVAEFHATLAKLHATLAKGAQVTRFAPNVATDAATFARDALDHLLRNNYEFAARCAANAVELETSHFGNDGVWSQFAECCVECRDHDGVTTQEETQ